MEEKFREVIEQYCYTHNTETSRRIEKLLTLAVDAMSGEIMMMEATDEDSLFLEEAIENETDEALKEALSEMNEFLFYEF